VVGADVCGWEWSVGWLGRRRRLGGREGDTSPLPESCFELEVVLDPVKTITSEDNQQ
jgi:hypothetical protein